MTTSRSNHFYKVHPQTCRPDDFWGQVKRTVNGKAVDQAQIDMLVGAIADGLDLQTSDVLLDIGCGNGALTDLIFAKCQGGVGVDFSETLIEVAHANFERLPARRYVLADAAAYVKTDAEAARFTKVLCCSSLQYFTDEPAIDLLRDLHTRYPHVTRIFLGNIPDRNLIDAFAAPQSRTPGIENDPDTAIGIWRTTEDMETLARRAGWRAAITRMPPAYFAARYRFDVILERAAA